MQVLDCVSWACRVQSLQLLVPQLQGTLREVQEHRLHPASSVTDMPASGGDLALALLPAQQVVQGRLCILLQPLLRGAAGALAVAPIAAHSRGSTKGKAALRAVMGWWNDSSTIT